MIASSLNDDEEENNSNNNNSNNNNQDSANNNNNNTQTAQTAKKWCKYFDELTMDMLRAGRVGIKKAPGSWRPVTLSNYWVKLTGALLLRRAKIKPTWNMALGSPNATKFIGNKARMAYEAGKCIIRLDMINAFGETERKRVEKILENQKIDKDLRSFFNVMNKKTSKLFLYGPKGRIDILDMEEGFRQGESLSTMLFILVMEEFCSLLSEKYPNEADVWTRVFVDDSTIVCDPHLARKVIHYAIQAARQVGFKVNLEKSSVICKNEIPPPADDEALLEMITINKTNDEFKMLGMLINNDVEAYDSYNNKIIQRIDKFFDNLDEIDIHVELKHQILMMCGSPRLLYYCETTPPQFAAEVVHHFQTKLKNSFAKLVDIKDVDSINDNIIYNYHGANLPNYVLHHKEIYDRTTYNMTYGNLSDKLMVKLSEQGLELFTSPECLHDRHWSNQTSSSRSRLCQLSPHQYKYALAIRCKLVPDGIRHDFAKPVFRCECQNNPVLVVTNKQQQNAQTENFISHIFSCQEINKHYYTERHNYVRDALIQVARSYGIQCTPEPSNYIYASGQNNRPDITFHLPTRANLTTDITVVHCSYDGDISKIGTRAAQAAAEKDKKHKDAVTAMGHQFIPFALESSGHLDTGAIMVINELAKFESS